jgi:hypothetical protein
MTRKKKIENLPALPKFRMVVQIINPEWTPDNGKQWDFDNGVYKNGGAGVEYYAFDEVECEVLSLHLNTHTMRVRYIDPTTKKIQTTDDSADVFFKNFKIVPIDPDAWEE